MIGRMETPAEGFAAWIRVDIGGTTAGRIRPSSATPRVVTVFEPRATTCSLCPCGPRTRPAGVVAVCGRGKGDPGA